MKCKYLSMALTAAAALTACGGRIVIEPQPIVPLYRDIAAADSGAAVDSLINAERGPLEALTAYLGADSLTGQAVETLRTSAPMQVFVPVVDSVFQSLDEIEAVLGSILYRAESDSLDIPRRDYAAVVWGRPKSIVIVDTETDSTVLIALNHYLGADYPGYSHWPSYLCISKTPEQLPYDLAEALVANRYPYHSAEAAADGATVLSRLVYEGALTLAKIKLVPNGTMAGALGYTDAQLRWLEENEARIWQMMVERKMLYDTSESTAERLVSPAPSTSVISPSSPGRIGRFIGYRILCAYMRGNARTTLAEMLSPDFYRSPAVLVQAAYEGQ